MPFCACCWQLLQVHCPLSGQMDQQISTQVAPCTRSQPSAWYWRSTGHQLANFRLPRQEDGLETARTVKIELWTALHVLPDIQAGRP